MSRGDQGGCCIAMYAGTPTFPSKAEHIMSRYRPIAPKPLAPKPKGTDPSDPQTSSSLSLDKGSSKFSQSKRRRSRKRQTDSSSVSTRNAKKAFIALCATGRNETRRKTPATTRSKRIQSSTSHNVTTEVTIGLTPILSESVAPVFGPGGLQRFNESSDRSRQSYLVTRSLVNNESRSYGVRDNSLVKFGFPGGSWNGGAPSLVEMPLRGIAIDKDAAFMKRAAASSPVSVGEGSGSRISNQRFDGGFSGFWFGEVIKGLPAAHGTMPELGMQNQSSLPSKDTGDCTVIKSNESLRGAASMPLLYASASYGGESEVCSGEDVGESRRTNLITLSLLPDAPLHGPSSPSDSSFPSPPSHAKSQSSLPSSYTYASRFDCNEGVTKRAIADTNLTMYSRGEWLLAEEECRDSTRNKELTNSRNSESTLLTDSFGPVAAKDFVEQVNGRTHVAIAPHLPAAAGSSDRHALNEPVVDSFYLDHMYATSSDAVMLTDDQNRILWSNPAFQRAATEKTSAKMLSAGPHIDPLGIPTQLGVLMFQPPYHAAKCKAVLWGFLKKFIFQEVGPCFADSRGLGEWKLLQA